MREGVNRSGATNTRADGCLDGPPQAWTNLRAVTGSHGGFVSRRSSMLCASAWRPRLDLDTVEAPLAEPDSRLAEHAADRADRLQHRLLRR